MAGSALSSASSFSPAAAALTACCCPRAVAALPPYALAEACSSSQMTRQYTAASGVMSSKSGDAASRRSPLPGASPQGLTPVHFSAQPKPFGSASRCVSGL